MNTLIKCGMKLSKNDEEEKINFTTFKSLVRCLRYLTHTHSYILFRIRLVSKFIKEKIMTHLKALK